MSGLQFAGLVVGVYALAWACIALESRAARLARLRKRDTRELRLLW